MSDKLSAAIAVECSMNVLQLRFHWVQQKAGMQMVCVALCMMQTATGHRGVARQHLRHHLQFTVVEQAGKTHATAPSHDKTCGETLQFRMDNFQDHRTHPKASSMRIDLAVPRKPRACKTMAS